MPTYDWRCAACGSEVSFIMSISRYVNEKPQPFCCSVAMERRLSVVPGLAVSNALAGDRHYYGLRATDGTDISSRAKHRAYMKAKGLTTADDFTQTWAKAAEERKARMAGEDKTRAADVADAITKLGG